MDSYGGISRGLTSAGFVDAEMLANNKCLILAFEYAANGVLSAFYSTAGSWVAGAGR